jgi:hypothetical protein
MEHPNFLIVLQWRNYLPFLLLEKATMSTLDLDLFSDGKRVVDFDTEISHCAFHSLVAQ